MTYQPPERRAWERLQRFQNLDPSWRTYSTFLADVGKRPTHFHSLRRHDRTKPFGPGNCVWKERKLFVVASMSGQVRALAKTLGQTERSIWRKFQLGLTFEQIRNGAKNLRQAVEMSRGLTDEEVRNQLTQKLAQSHADLKSASEALKRAKAAVAAVQKAILEAEVGEIESAYQRPKAPEPKTKPQTPTPKPAPAPEPVKYTSFDLKLKEEKELARKKLMGADAPFNF